MAATARRVRTAVSPAADILLAVPRTRNCVAAAAALGQHRPGGAACTQQGAYNHIRYTQGATMCFDIDRKASSPTWALRNQPTPPVGNLYGKTLMY